MIHEESRIHEPDRESRSRVNCLNQMRSKCKKGVQPMAELIV
jgi:hypothetical protein